MSADRLAAVVAGALYFPGLMAGVFSVVPVIDLPDYLVQILTHVGQVTWGASCQFLMMAAYVGMAITLYPILQTHNERLALGYVGFRLVAAVLIVIGVILQNNWRIMGVLVDQKGKHLPGGTELALNHTRRCLQSCGHRNPFSAVRQTVRPS